MYIVYHRGTKPSSPTQVVMDNKGVSAKNRDITAIRRVDNTALFRAINPLTVIDRERRLYLYFTEASKRKCDNRIIIVWSCAK